MRTSSSSVSRVFATAMGIALIVGGALVPVRAWAALPQPTKVAAAPSDGSIAFTWAPVPGASAYRLEVSRSGSFSGAPADTAASVTTYATSWIAPTTLDLASAGELWYRVSAYGTGTAESTRGEPSIAQKLSRDQLATPTLLAPSDEATINYPTPVSFSWSSVPGAVSYDVEYIAGEFGSSSATSTTANTTATTFVPQKPLDPGLSYEWHVRANYFSGTSTPVVGGWSTVRSLTVQWPASASQPTLLSPANSGSDPIVSDPQLRWSPVAGAKEYQVRLGASKDASGNIVSPTLVTVTGTAYIPPNTAFSNTNYFWQVVAYDANGGAGTPSEVWQFKKAMSYSADATTSGAPADVYPKPRFGTSDAGQPEEVPLNELELKWDPVPRATLYQVEVVPHNGDPRLTCNTASTSATIVASFLSTGTEKGRLQGSGVCLWSADYTKRIRPGVSYTWRVRAIDYLGSATTGIQAAVADNAIVSDWSDEEVTGQDSRKRWFTVTQPATSGAEATEAPTLNLDTFGETQTIDSLAGQPAPLLTWKPFNFGNAGLAADQWQRLGYEVTIYAKGVGSSTQVAVVRTPQTMLRINGVFDDNQVDEPYSASVRPIVLSSLSASWAGTITYPADSSADRFVWTKTSKTIDVSPGPQNLPDGTVVLTWNPQFTTAKLDGGSRGYAITIRDSADKVVGTAGYKIDLPFLVAQNTLTNKPLPQGNYTYQVAPLDADGNATRYSEREAFSINLPAPAIESEAPAVAASQAVTWSPSTAAFKYQLRYKPASASSTTWTTIGTAATTVGAGDRVQTAHVFTDLAPGDYVWQLRSVDTAGNVSAWSSEATFTIGGQPLELTTTDAAVLPVKDRVLRWKPLPDASRYVLELSTDANLASATTYETVGTALAVPTPVVAGTAYYWRVKAVPEVANTASSRPVLATSAIRSFSVRTVPVAVKSAKATTDRTSLLVTWTALTGADAGTTDALQYVIQVRRQILGDDWSAAQTITSVAAATSTLVEGLATSTTYEARVAAVNSEGQGPWSAVIAATTASAPTAAPTSLLVTPGLGSLTLSWRPPTGAGTGGIALTGFVVRYRTGDAAWAEVPVVPTATSYALTGLAGYAQYAVEVAAVNALGTGPAATATSTTLSAPGAVAGFTASRGDTSAVLSWVAPASNGGSPLTGYAVQQRAYNATTKSWSSWVTVTVTTTTRTVTGLVNGALYQFRVAAVTKVATGDYSAEASVTPAGKPGASPKPTIKAKKGKFTISWKAAADNGAAVTAYVVEYSTGKGTWTRVGTTKGTVRSLTTTKGKKGKTYSFRVLAQNVAGNGPYSAVAKAKKK